jgi:hypothetical protein
MDVAQSLPVLKDVVHASRFCVEVTGVVGEHEKYQVSLLFFQA